MKRIFGNLLVALLSVAMTLLLVELAVRLVIFGSAAFSVEQMNSTHHLGVSGLLQASSRPEVMFELKPNLHTTFKLVEFTTTAEGLRDRAYSREKPDGVFRIAVIGDSFTMGSGVTIEDTFHSVLETTLNNGAGPLKFEVINFGVGGYTLRQYAAVLENIAHAYAPDMVIIGYCVDTDHQIHPERRYQERFVPNPIDLPFYRSFASQVASLALYKAGFTSMISSDEAMPESASRASPGEVQKYFDTIFGRLARYQRDHGVPILVAYLTIRPWNKERVDSVVRSHGLASVDTGPRFPEGSSRDYRIYLLDFHPNVAAHKMYAEEILDALGKNGMIPNASTGVRRIH